jgi:hypothetical protein
MKTKLRKIYELKRDELSSKESNLQNVKLCNLHNIVNKTVEAEIGLECRWNKLSWKPKQIFDRET